jgi:6-phosphogluconate dehydrogenase
MKIGMVGLGKMGANMTQRLIEKGHQVVAFDLSEQARAGVAAKGADTAATLAEMVSKLDAPRVAWVMVPAGDATTSTIDTLKGLMARGDAVIDGGNSNYKEAGPTAASLAEKGIGYVDAGTSGGVWGLANGYCLMVGGENSVVAICEPVFLALAPDGGYAHVGPVGAGHFVKMVHNGIEYGLMQAYAEGLNILRHANVGDTEREADAETTPLRDPERYRYDLDVAAVTEVWRRGSVVASWLLDLTAAALNASPDLEGYAGRVSDSGEGRWTLLAAIDESVPVPVLSAALYERFTSRGEAEFANRVLSAMRHAFGGHLEKTA